MPKLITQMHSGEKVRDVKGLFSADQLLAMELDPVQRPEQVSVGDWVRLALAAGDNH